MPYASNDMSVTAERHNVPQISSLSINYSRLEDLLDTGSNPDRCSAAVCFHC